ncbi:hypothetical protein KPL71_015583 [Citrus sinensis]|uniref:Disease resistance protein At4g27190-like leucine-rich repeats domain-containing protein n=2 Tax=Citrus sinensis TaxID=2711 RepID=A0A067E3U7_CITSI|nr:hypothetical protein KPL71_015583 [Citrus sinensis]KDO48540.1 hypothetical protein CISIN_1g036873mg [Citrus sinensis]
MTELINLVTSSAAKGLVRLVTLRVFECSAMTQVVTSDEDGGAKDEIVFSKLKTLSLLDLDSLTSFCSSNHTFTFPSLQYLVVTGCPNLKIFAVGELCTPPRVDIWCTAKGDGHHWAIDLNTTIQQLHAEKVWLYISLT